MQNGSTSSIQSSISTWTQRNLPQDNLSPFAFESYGILTLAPTTQTSIKERSPSYDLPELSYGEFALKATPQEDLDLLSFSSLPGSGSSSDHGLPLKAVYRDAVVGIRYLHPRVADSTCQPVHLLTMVQLTLDTLLNLVPGLSSLSNHIYYCNECRSVHRCCPTCLSLQIESTAVFGYSRSYCGYGRIPFPSHHSRL